MKKVERAGAAVCSALLSIFCFTGFVVTTFSEYSYLPFEIILVCGCLASLAVCAENTQKAYDELKSGGVV